MADSLQFPPELQARLVAAGVTDQDSLLVALQADPDLERDYRAFLEANQEQIQALWLQQMLAAFIAAPDTGALAQL
ncbi:MAG: hypothetical protein OHK0022_22120 [Roseiflexaceae bacterium]